jgi:hypothetical protein
MKTAKTQPFAVGDTFIPTCPEPGSVQQGMRSGCVFTPYYTEPTAIAPGTDGGLSWAPMSYSPQTKLLYVCGTVNVSGHELREQLFNESTGQLVNKAGTGRGFFRLPWPQRAASAVTAMDPTISKIVWQKKLPWPCDRGGFYQHGQQPVFHGESDGHLVVHDAESGDAVDVPDRRRRGLAGGDLRTGERPHRDHGGRQSVHELGVGGDPGCSNWRHAPAGRGASAAGAKVPVVATADSCV